MATAKLVEPSAAWAICSKPPLIVGLMLDGNVMPCEANVAGGVAELVCANDWVKHPTARMPAKSETLRSVLLFFMDLFG